MRCGLAYPRGRSPPPPTLRTGRCGRSATGCPPGTLKGRCLRRARSDIASHEAQPEKGVRVSRTRRGATTTGDRRTDSSIRVLGHGQTDADHWPGLGRLPCSRRFVSVPALACFCDAPTRLITRRDPPACPHHPRGVRAAPTETSRRARRGRRGRCSMIATTRRSRGTGSSGPTGRWPRAAPAPAAHARGGPVQRGEGRHARCAPARADVDPAPPAAVAPPARLSPHHARGGRGAARARRAARRDAAPADPAHLGVAGAQRERLARCPPRLRGLVRPRGPRRRAATGRTRSRATTTCPPTSRRRCWARR